MTNVCWNMLNSCSTLDTLRITASMNPFRWFPLARQTVRVHDVGFRGSLLTGPWNMSRSIPSVNSLFVPGTYDDMVGWGWSHQISPIQPFKSYIYIFTFFPVTRVLKVVIPIGCPVGPEVQTLGIFGSNPFYNLIQLIYIYICITLFPQPFQWGSLDLVSADPSPPLLILILCPGLPAPNRTCPSNYASGERLNILYIHIYICIFMDWGQCLRLWVCMVHL